jgi:uncharacterized protein YihD (DUF1040 family)
MLSLFRLLTAQRRISALDSRISDLDSQLVAARLRLADPLRDSDFPAYCAKYGADHQTLMVEARAKVARDGAAHSARIAARNRGR